MSHLGVTRSVTATVREQVAVMPPNGMPFSRRKRAAPPRTIAAIARDAVGGNGVLHRDGIR